MNGMYCMEWYWHLSEEDPAKFEDRLMRWAQKREPNEIMLFDKSAIKVGKAIRVEGENPIYRLELPHISVEYINVYAEMCVLSQIIVNDKKEERVIYKMPEQWNGCVPWYAR